MASRYFSRPVTPDQVVHTYSGVRPLLEDEASEASAVTRDYRLDLNRDRAAVLSVFGGKITTYRKLSEEAVDLLAPLLGPDSRSRGRWTATAPLPGGDLPDGDFDGFPGELRRRFAWLSERSCLRLARAYGSRALALLDGALSAQDLGVEVASGLYERELVYLRDTEWARTGDDILWRRTKLGLHFSKEERQAVSDWMRPTPREALLQLSGRNDFAEPT